MPRELTNLVGQRFGRLTVTANYDRRPRQKTRWSCKCDCGGEAVADVTCLRRGKTQSCGCLQKERLGNATRTHGRCESPLYKIWQDMRRRCNDPNNGSWGNYGGRGIKVCDRWNSSFAAFLSDMGDRPVGHSLDRIDNNGDYEPANCRWASGVTQANNRRSCRFLTIQGETKTLTQWARSAGLNTKIVSRRLRRGWSAERALSTEPRKCKPPKAPQRKKIALSDLTAMALCQIITKRGEPLIPFEVREKGKKAILSYVEWDHIVPLALGGADHFSNLQPLSKADHRAKTKRDMANIARARRLSSKQGARVREAADPLQMKIFRSVEEVNAAIDKLPKKTKDRRKGAPMTGSKASPWKRKLNGQVVAR